MSTRHYLLSHFLARNIKNFIGGGGHLELLRRGFKTWKISDFNVPEKLKERGVDDPNEVCYLLGCRLSSRAQARESNRL